MTADSGVTGGFLSVKVQRVGGLARVIVSGEVDLGTVGQLREALDSALNSRPSALVIDLGGVIFMDAAGVAALVRARTQAAHDNASYVVVNLRPLVWRILDVTATLHVLTGDDRPATTNV